MTCAARDWLLDPRADRGVHLAGDSGDDWGFTSYRDLALRARRVAGALIADGVRPGDDVAVLMPTGLPCLAALFGTWAAGAAFTPIAPPALGASGEYTAHVAGVLRQAAPRVVVVSAELAAVAAEAMRTCGRTDSPWVYREAPEPVEPVAPGDAAVLQFTSGSTGSPRGVRITWRNLAANLAATRRLTGWRDGEGAGSWLPLYHDMGLVGALLTTVAMQGDLWLMRPEEFVRDPVRWLRTMARAEHAACPSFALAYTARRVGAGDLDGLDLSGWRSLVVGAEPVDAGALEAFVRTVRPAGFSPAALVPAFGLAEATLAVTGAAEPRPPRAIRVDPAGTRFGEPMRILAERRIGDGPLDDASGWLVGCGRPEGGTRVSVVGDDGRALPDGSLGEIVVTGPSVAEGYHAASGDATRFVDGALHTGDAGLLHDGELFVLGRMGTSLKVRGRSVYVEDLETAVSAATGLAKGRFAVVGAPGPGTGEVVVFAEAAPGDWLGTARQALRGLLGPDADVVVVTADRGLIPRTSSGKPQRRRLWEAFRTGDLTGATVHPARAVPGGRRANTTEHPVPILDDGLLRGLLDKTRRKVELPQGAAVVLEGSIAEGFGNASSDIDFLAVAPGEASLPTMPSVLFVDGRRVEIRTRSVAQLMAQLERAAAALDRGRGVLRAADEDLLNRCQRFLRARVLEGGDLIDRVRTLLPYPRFAELMTRWWTEHARQSLRQAVALRTLGQHDEAAGWARGGLLQAAKAWAASRGETYVETKWLSMQLDRIGDGEVADGYHALERLTRSGADAAAHVPDVLALARTLGVTEAGDEPGRLVVQRVRGVTSWTMGERVHIVRGDTDVFVLSPDAGAVWRSVVFGRALPDIVDAAPVPYAGSLLAEFLRLGLIRLTWRGGGPVTPSPPLCPPTRPVTPPPAADAPVLTVGGATAADGRAVSLSPLPARRFTAAALTLVWSNVLIENAREDLTGALRNGQWRVAETAAERMLLVALRGVLSAHGVHPLPPDTDLVRFLHANGLGTRALRDAARRLASGRSIDSPQTGTGILSELDEFTCRVREFTGADAFPSSFDSGAEWRRTLEIGYDWLRLGSHLGCDLPIAEAGDLLATGGHQPHVAPLEDR